MSAGAITRLLQRVRAGERAQDDLYRLVYAELLVLARARLANEAPVALDSAEIVHEAFLRLSRRGALPGEDRRSFFAYAASVMRSVVADELRDRRAGKRGGGEAPITLVTAIEQPRPDTEVESLNDALDALERIDARSHQVVELRYFGGLSLDEVADVLALSTATVKRDWEKARAFLMHCLDAG